MVKSTRDKKDNDALRLKQNVSICGLCKSMGVPPPCKGHGVRGGGGGGGGGDSTKKTEEKSHTPTERSQGITASSKTTDIHECISLMTSTAKIAHFTAGLLLIESDKLRGNLIISPRSDHLTKEEMGMLDAYLKTVDAEFNQFKNKLAEDGISVKDFTSSIKDHVLTIHIPNQKYYEAFIKHLASKNLLAIPEEWRQDKKHESNKDTTKQEEKSFNPSPLATKPKPKGTPKDT